MKNRDALPPREYVAKDGTPVDEDGVPLGQNRAYNHETYVHFGESLLESPLDDPAALTAHVETLSALIEQMPDAGEREDAEWELARLKDVAATPYQRPGYTTWDPDAVLRAGTREIGDEEGENGDPPKSTEFRDRLPERKFVDKSGEPVDEKGQPLHERKSKAYAHFVEVHQSWPRDDRAALISHIQKLEGLLRLMPDAGEREDSEVAIADLKDCAATPGPNGQPDTWRLDF